MLLILFCVGDVKAGEEEVDERNLTLLQRKFRNAWFDNAVRCLDFITDLHLSTGSV